jgi:hypothetical protein
MSLKTPWAWRVLSEVSSAGAKPPQAATSELPSRDGSAATAACASANCPER